MATKTRGREEGFLWHFPHKIRVLSSTCPSKNTAAKAFHKDATDSPLIYISVFVLPLIYGGIHLAAWCFQLSHASRTCPMESHRHYYYGQFICLPHCNCSPGISGTRWERFRRHFDVSEQHRLPPVDYCCSNLSCCWVVSVRQLPIGVYMTAEWSNYIPHL